MQNDRRNHSHQASQGEEGLLYSRPEAHSSSNVKLAERFISINGEGAHSGTLAAFIRFPGCNLSCSYCDTTWANKPDCPTQSYSILQLCEWVRTSRVQCVTITGGEPAIQPSLPKLISNLYKMFEALQYAEHKPSNSSHTSMACGVLEALEVQFNSLKPACIEIETNGSIDLLALHKLRTGLYEHSRTGSELAASNNANDGAADEYTGICANYHKNACGSVIQDVSCAAHTTHPRICFTMDWKLPCSGMEARMCPSNCSLLGADDVCKFVVGSEDDLHEMLRVCTKYNLAGRVPVYISPLYGKMDPSEIVVFMQEHAMWWATLQLQMHKIIWPGVEKGV